MEVWRTFQCEARKVKKFLSANQTTRELNFDDVMRFLEKARTDPIIGHHFKDLKESRMTEIAERMLALLNYAFKYDRIYPFTSLFTIHSMMALKTEEVNAFFNLLMKEAFANELDLLPSHMRILNRMKSLILHGNMKAISDSDVLQFESILKSNPILKERFKNINTKQTENIMKQFAKILHPGGMNAREELIQEVIDQHRLMWISADEYDEFTKVFLELYEDKDFLTEVAPVRKKMRESLIVSEPNYELQI